jgi:hypothetical protein
MILDHSKDSRAHAVYDFLGLGLHGDIIASVPTVNIPVWAHTVLQISKGSLDKHSNWKPNRLYAKFMRYDWCCDKRIQKLGG